MGNIDIGRKENTIVPRESSFFPSWEKRGLIMETNGMAVHTAWMMDSLFSSIFLTRRALKPGSLAPSMKHFTKIARGARFEFEGNVTAEMTNSKNVDNVDSNFHVEPAITCHFVTIFLYRWMLYEHVLLCFAIFSRKHGHVHVKLFLQIFKLLYVYINSAIKYIYFFIFSNRTNVNSLYKLRNFRIGQIFEAICRSRC